VNLKPGRNDPCPCGSGKKYKKCCGRESQSESAGIPDLGELAGLVNTGRFADLEVRARDLTRSHPNSGLAWKAFGVALSMQGKDALHALERAAELSPDDAEAHANLGNALLDRRRPFEAKTSYQRALEAAPGFAEAHSNLGNALQALGHFEEAIASYLNALRIRPDLAITLNNLGNAQRRVGRPSEAMASYRRALEINPAHAEASNNLGNALLDIGQFDEAAASYRRALGINPHLTEAYSNLGNALRSLGQLDDAIASYRQALTLNPNFAAAHSNLGDALRDRGEAQSAVESGRRAIDIDPRSAGSHNSLGNALLDLGQLDAAAASYRQALALDTNFGKAHVNLGMVHRLNGRTAEAEGSCRRALEIQANPAAMVLLAELRADSGAFGEAESWFRRAAEIDPRSPEAWAGIAHLRRMTVADAPWFMQAQGIADQHLPPRQEVYLRYAMGKYLDDVGEYDQAFAHFARANELMKLNAYPYDGGEVSRAIDRLVNSYDRSWARRQRANALLSSRPVFIVGMPRSGTTLAEQILASHPAVFGAGELLFWNTAAAKYRAATLAGRDGDAVTHELGSDYLNQLNELSADALRVVDKMPANFMSLGLIHDALPNARIIHLQRDPRDICLSIYFQHFKTSHAYANDLVDLAHYYRQYQRLMDHWHSTLPADSILTVSYEELVGDQEKWSRAMVEFVGLPWDARCLDFHRTNRSVLTASKWQVRQKISKTAVDRWRNYEKYLGPLRDLAQ
jgi:tetratricopeptide (TPR) repeat protein